MGQRLVTEGYSGAKVTYMYFRGSIGGYSGRKATLTILTTL